MDRKENKDGRKNCCPRDEWDEVGTSEQNRVRIRVRVKGQTTAALMLVTSLYD